MADIFISWSTPDRNLVQAFANALRSAGFGVDEYSVDPSGGNIDDNVRRYVKDARVVIFVLSANSVKSPGFKSKLTGSTTVAPNPIRPR